MTRQVDQNGLKTGQAIVIILLILAFVLSSPILVAFIAVAQLLGALDVPFAPFRLIYKYVVRLFVRPNVIHDNPEPHRFSMLVGAIFDGVGALAVVAGGGSETLGWLLVGIVIVLANLNFWVNFCLGCWMYYQFHRLGVPGFKYAPVK